MRVAQIAPLCESVPPRLYGGTERIVAYLTDALVELGCEVTLFASAEACTLARLEPMRHQAVRLDPSPLKSETAAHLSMLKRVRARAHEFDVLHFHLDMLHFPIFESLAHRTITTQHGRLDLEDYPALFEAWPQYPLVSISQQQREPLRLAHWIGTVPHGIPSSLLQFTAGNAGDYVAFLGRLSPEKRPDVAIEIARRAGIPLRIAAKIDNADATYFRSSIEPLLCAGGVQFIGEIGDERKSGFLGSALALLFPMMAGAIRTGHAGGDGVRHPGHRLATRIGSRGDRGRRHRRYRRFGRRSRQRIAVGTPCRPRGHPSQL